MIINDESTCPNCGFATKVKRTKTGVTAFCTECDSTEVMCPENWTHLPLTGSTPPSECIVVTDEMRELLKGESTASIENTLYDDPDQEGIPAQPQPHITRCEARWNEDESLTDFLAIKELLCKSGLEFKASVPDRNDAFIIIAYHPFSENYSTHATEWGLKGLMWGHYDFETFESARIDALERALHR